MPPKRVRTLRYIREKECTMIDPATGELFPAIHKDVRQTEEYDSDYNRTIFHYHCYRCGEPIGLN